MDYFSEALQSAFQLILNLDKEMLTIIWTSLNIALQSIVYASLFAVPLGITCAIKSFSGKTLLRHILNTLMAMPTVMIGLIFYGLLSRRGAFGEWGLLYTQQAVILGQTCLIIPLITNLTLVAVESASSAMLDTLKILGANTAQQILTIISELRYVLLATIITAFGRAIGEVGAAMMLGGNIQGETRTMTTAIALETSKGNFELGLALGLILLVIAFIISLSLQYMNQLK